MKLDRAALYGGGAYLFARAFEGLFGGAIADAAKQAGWYDNYPRVLTFAWAALSSTPATMLFAAVLGGAVAVRLGRGAADPMEAPALALDPEAEAAAQWQRTVGAALPGRVATIEPQVARHGHVLANQSLAIRYADGEAALDRAVATIEKMLPECRAAHASKVEPETSLQAMNRTQSRRALGLVLQQLEAELAATLRAPVNLTAHHNYTLNPMRAVAGDGDIEDPEQRQEYRRVHDQAVTALATLRRLHGIVSSARSAAERVTVDLTDTPLI